MSHTRQLKGRDLNTTWGENGRWKQPFVKLDFHKRKEKKKHDELFWGYEGLVILILIPKQIINLFSSFLICFLNMLKHIEILCVI
jgi:uncharacterized membrane protein